MIHWRTANNSAKNLRIPRPDRAFIGHINVFHKVFSYNTGGLCRLNSSDRIFLDINAMSRRKRSYCISGRQSYTRACVFVLSENGLHRSLTQLLYLGDSKPRVQNPTRLLDGVQFVSICCNRAFYWYFQLEVVDRWQVQWSTQPHSRPFELT